MNQKYTPSFTKEERELLNMLSDNTRIYKSFDGKSLLVDDNNKKGHMMVLDLDLLSGIKFEEMKVNEFIPVKELRNEKL